MTIATDRIPVPTEIGDGSGTSSGIGGNRSGNGANGSDNGSNAASTSSQTKESPLERFLQRASGENARIIESSVWRMSYLDYLAQVVENPHPHLRTSIQILRDTFAYFGNREEIDPVSGRKIVRNRVFDDPLGNGARKVYGIDDLLARFVDFVERTADEIQEERLFVFCGPPGSAKSQVIGLITKAVEYYTTLPEGILATAGFAFDGPLQKSGVQLGFSHSNGVSPAQAKDAYPVAKYLKGEKLDFPVVPCAKHCHPLLYLPKEMRIDLLYTIYLTHLLRDCSGVTDPERKKLEELDSEYTSKKDALSRSEARQQRDGFIDEMRKKYDVLPGLFLPRKLLQQDACKNCTNVLNALMSHYGISYADGKMDVNSEAWLQVLGAHVLVERLLFIPNEAGLAVIEARDSESRGAVLQKHMEQAVLLDALPEVTKALMTGPYVNGNRGLVEIIELFKDLSRLLPLFGIISEQRVSFAPDLTEDIDCIIISSTNLTDARKMLASNELIGKPLRRRMEIFNVPYVTKVSDEDRIYEDVRQRMNDCEIKFEPHTPEMISLYAVATRLLRPNKDNYAASGRLARLETLVGESPLEQNALELLDSLTPVQKARILDGSNDILPKQQRLLITPRLIRLMQAEYADDEAMSGMSPSTVKDGIYSELAGRGIRNIGFFDFEAIIKEKLASEDRDDNEQFFGLEQEPNEGYLPQDRSDLNHGFMDPKEILEHVREEYLRITKIDIDECLTGVAYKDVITKFEEYLVHLRALTLKQKVRNPRSRQDEPPDEQLMQTIESMMPIAPEVQARERDPSYSGLSPGTGTRESFRQRILNTYSTESTAASKEGRALRTTMELFGDELYLLRNNMYRNSQGAYVPFEQLREAFRILKQEDVKEKPQKIDNDPNKKARTVVYWLMQKGYSFEGAKQLLLVHGEEEAKRKDGEKRFA